jgi:hypothetical protein
MRAFILCCVIALYISSCASQQKVMTSYMGASKQTIVMNFGPPARIASDANNGEIYIYERAYMMYNVVRYEHKMIYINSDNKAYYWRIESGPVPAQQMNVNMYLH